MGSVGNPLSLTAPGRRLSSQGDMGPQIQPDSRSNGCCPPNPRQPPSLLRRVHPHPWVWRRVHWPVLSTACLPHVNLPAPRPPQAIGRLRQPLEPDHTLGQVSHLCVCHPGPTVDRNPHCLGERGEEWRGWRLGPGLPHACHQHLSPSRGWTLRTGHWPCLGCPLQGGVSPGGHRTGPAWMRPGGSASWQPPLPAPARTFRTCSGLQRVVVTRWGSAGPLRPVPPPRAHPCPQGPGAPGAQFRTWPEAWSGSLLGCVGCWMRPGEVGLTLGNT